MIYRCPLCRTRRKDHGLFLKHLEQSGHQVCSCSGYAFPHRRGSALCSPPAISVTPEPMAKQLEDVFTLELKLPRGRGRPSKPDALTPAERAKAYRDRKKAAAKKGPPMWRGRNGETWTGRGQRPAWFKAHLEQFGLPDFS